MNNSDDNYNFSALNPNSQKALVGMITGFYSGAAHFAKSNNIPLQIAEFEFAKTCIVFSRALSEAETSELVAAIDSDRVSLFSDEMSQRVWKLAKAQEAAAQEAEDDEDFSFVDEDDLIDYLNDYSNIEDIDTGEADE